MTGSATAPVTRAVTMTPASRPDRDGLCHTGNPESVDAGGPTDSARELSGDRESDTVPWLVWTLTVTASD